MALTNEDKKYIAELISTSQNEIFERFEEVTEEQNKRFEQLPTREEIDEKISHLPTKDEFYEENDKLMKELKDSREEDTILSHQVSDHEDRLQALEAKLV